MKADSCFRGFGLGLRNVVLPSADPTFNNTELYSAASQELLGSAA